MLKTFVCLATALAATTSMAVSASAGTLTAQLPISATVPAACSKFLAGSIGFSNVFTSNTSQTSIIVNCAANVPYTVALDPGTNPSIQNTCFRRMSGPPGSFLGYGLFTDPAMTVNFCTAPVIGGVPSASQGSAVNQTGTGIDQVITVYAKTDTPSATLAPGTYSDTVTATLTF